MSDARRHALPVLTSLIVLLGSAGAQEPTGRGQLSGAPSLRVATLDEHDQELRVTPVVRAVRRAQASVVCIDILDADAPVRDRVRPDGQGSGVILDEEGLVITNWHVVHPVLSSRGGYRLQVRLKDGSHYEARVLSSSPEYDLALLQLELGEGKVRPIEIADSGDLMVGETVVAIGNPQGQAHTVTAGVLSAVDREIKVRTPDGELRDYRGLLQTDAAINRGNSGGALLDITGRLVGINNAMAVGVENIGFAIPVNTVRQVFEEVLLSSDRLTQHWTRTFLGLELEDGEGAPVVTAVAPRSPADRAGLRPGDRLERVGDEEVDSTFDYARRLLTLRPGEPLDLAVRRDGELRRFTPRPVPLARWQVRQLVDLRVEKVTPEQDRELVVRATRALGYRGLLPSVLRVEEVVEGGLADEAGIERGDVILGVVAVRSHGLFGRLREADVATPTSEELVRYLLARKGRTVEVIVLRGRELLDGPLRVHDL